MTGMHGLSTGFTLHLVKSGGARLELDHQHPTVEWDQGLTDLLQSVVGGDLSKESLTFGRQCAGTRSTAPESCTYCKGIHMSSQFTFLSTGDATTCGATDITWFYEGADGLLSLLVTNVGVSQDNPIPTSTRHFTPVDSPTGTTVVNARAIPTGISQSTAPTSVVIGTNIDSDELKFLWEPVAVQPGWYIIQASISEQDLNVVSSPFFVQGSTDTSCLPPTTSSSTTPSSTTPPPASSTNSVSPSETATSTNPSGTAVPIAGASSSGLSKGAITGITLGALALALGWFAAWWFLFRKSKRSSRSQGTGGVKQLGHRSALTSMDSTSGLMGKPSRSPFASRQPSTGTIPLSPLDDEVGLEKGSMNSTYHSAFLDGPHMNDHAQLPLSQGGRKYSGSSALTLDFPPLDYSQTSRRPSHAESAYGRQSVESTTYPPTSPQSSGQNATSFVSPGMLTRSHSVSTSATHEASAFNQGGGPHSTTSHSGLLYQASAASSAAPSPSPYSMREPSSPDSSSSPSDFANVNKQARRHSVSNKKRKPVPAYDPGAEELVSTPVSATPVPGSSSPSPIPPPSPVPPSTTAPLHSPHYTTRNRSQPELTHKSSFGPGGLEGKQLHYLIPDMPAPSKG